jgi:hypothetical protein
MKALSRALSVTSAAACVPIAFTGLFVLLPTEVAPILYLPLYLLLSWPVLVPVVLGASTSAIICSVTDCGAQGSSPILEIVMPGVSLILVALSVLACMLRLWGVYVP